MKKHTPGPWRVEIEDYDRVISAPPLEGCTVETTVAVCPDWPFPPYKGLVDADARLIAAAPDQHEALRLVSEGVNSIIDNWAYWTDEYKQQHLIGLQAIAMDAHRKARGTP